MNITAYDEGVLNYIKNMFSNTVWGSPSQAFRNLALRNEDKTTIPFISIWRSSTDRDPNPNITELRLGWHIQPENPEEARDKIIVARSLPLLLQYDIDIWGNSDDEAVAILCELYFAIMDSPTFLIKPKNFVYETKVSLVLKDFANNSDTIDRTERGNLSRYTIVCECPARIVARRDLDKYKVYLQDILPDKN